MTDKNGRNFVWQKNQSYQEKNLKWYATCTEPTINITYQTLAPVTQKR